MPEDASPTKRLGDFEIIRELGRGGMGIVYEARQVSLNRKVALKVISGSLGLSSKAVLRFQREAEAAGKLHHTNIVPIYSTGNDDGAHYYAMELIDGPSLHQVIRSLRSGDRKSAQVSGSAATMAVGTQPAVSTGESVLDSSGAVETPTWVSGILGSPPVSGESTSAPKLNAEAGSTSLPSSGNHLSSSYFDTVATMIAGVADALDYAHENGVIHRDIKPANLLLSRDGRVSINDFGLARMLEQPGMTMSGEFVGSPLYMSPEQITAGRAPLDHRTDIYSLGATLYELLTLKPVFPGTSRDEVIGQILHKEPERPRRQNPKVPVDLETICLKAMEKDPDRRYQTAGQFAKDLRRFVNRHTISARRIGPVERAVRWTRKNKAVTAMACFALIISVAASIFLYGGWIEKRKILCKQAMDNALFAALSGDFLTAKDEIDKARNLGAEAAWELLLNGQLALLKGDSATAVKSLEVAAKKTGSVMAQSLLAEAFLANGEWTQFVKNIEELDELPVITPEDYLFKGIALRLFAPDKALLGVREAIRERKSFILAWIWHARITAFLGQDRDNEDYILAALAEFDVVSQHLGKSPLLSNGRLMALLTACHIYQRDGSVEKAVERLREAKSEVEYLGNFPNFLYGTKSRLLYYAVVSDFEAMDRVMQEDVELVSRGYILDAYCAALYGEDRIEEALMRLDTMPGQDNIYLIWARIVFLMDNPSSRARAKGICDDFIKGYSKDSPKLFDVLAQLFLRGDADELAGERARNIGESKYWKLPRHILHYLSDDLTEGELIQLAGKSERNMQEVHFFVGVRQLAEGRRPEARSSFEKSAASTVFDWSASMWARAFLARMEKDPTWPDWLPAKPVGSEAK